MGKNLYETPRDRHKWNRDTVAKNEGPLSTDSKRDRVAELKDRLKKKKSK